ncbi:FAS1 domain-containing protein [Amniculicola lignicola CBS 123094]|uniref:FAS1 domain-containing protein n=1 Tax=Amniculicola lignicola CBS 123094 TaxID=1392246 RepID=A0A6A5WPQ5_9PLEO|nr:FAS1 domain-containing protein [Amniculicola lignicola CBS 123094]
MQLKHLPLLALAALTAAQNNTNSSLVATLSNNPDLSNLTTFLGTIPGLVETLSAATNITIIAPSNQAFADLLAIPGIEAVTSDPGAVAALLQYHVLNGMYMANQITNMSAFVPTLLTNGSFTNVTGGQVVEAVMMGEQTLFYSGLLANSSVVQADVNFNGGVLHVVDRVLSIPGSVTDTALAVNLTSFRGALNATNTIPTINETPDLTIFAPDNEAFRSISSALQNLSTTDLTNILTYHVIAGSVVYSSDLVNGSSVGTLNGGNLTITIDEDGTVFVNAARVIVPNVLVANGVIHIIDNVLNPAATTGPSPSATSGAPGFSATPGSEIPFTSGQPTPTTQVNPTSGGAGPASTGAGEPASTMSEAAGIPMKTPAVGLGMVEAAALLGVVGFMGY